MVTNGPLPVLTAKDFANDLDVRWCPGCGDYSILAQMKKILPEIGVPKEKIVFVSGIGCSSRFPYYLSTFGFHTIHGRAPTIASGLKLANPDLSVWVITGDGDGLSIGGNHLMHAIRRNINLNIILFNNRIYGLTKGQYSPTSPLGHKTKSTPFGSLDRPITALTLAIAAEATFVARTADRNPIICSTSSSGPPSIRVSLSSRSTRIASSSTRGRLITPSRRESRTRQRSISNMVSP